MPAQPRPAAAAAPPLPSLARLRITLAAPGPWLVALSFAMYSGQWLAVIGFLPSIYVQSGVAGATAGVLTAVVAAVNMVGNIASGRLLQRGVAPARLLVIGFVTMGLAAAATFAGGGDAGLAPTLRYGAVLLFSGVGGLIPATLVRAGGAPRAGRRHAGDDGRLGPAVVGARPVRRAAAGGRGRERRRRLAVDVDRHGRMFRRGPAADDGPGAPVGATLAAGAGGFRREFPSCLKYPPRVRAGTSRPRSTMSSPSNPRPAHVMCALLATFAASSPAAAADACDALYNAGIKSIQTPHHVYSTRTIGGKARTGEAIFAGGSEYLLMNGKWRRSAIPQPEMVAAAQEKLKTHPDTCTAVGEQVVGGQAVSVYKAHSKEEGTDQTVRILKASGLMQGGTLTLPDGGSLETRYEYENVQAPPGVK